MLCSASTIHDDGKDGSESDLEETDPCDLLEAHVASQAHTLIFGEGNKKGCAKSVSKTAAKRDAPGISVFVVSSNPNMERKICHMFRDVPAKLFKLRNTDFFSAEEGVYPTMGVDRVAAMYGAKLHYGAPTLVIDGGTAMTYTMLDEKSQIIGGGISPGVKVRLQSLADYTGSLPTIDHLKFKTAVEGAIASKTPLPFFAKDTEMAMVRSAVAKRKKFCSFNSKNVYTNTARCLIASKY
jgi:pantothenate kinase type III